ncbi:hypothetical protein [Saccharopolyspora sp. NPDC050642]
MPTALCGMHAGVQFMAYYVAILFVPEVIGLAWPEQRRRRTSRGLRCVD